MKQEPQNMLHLPDADRVLLLFAFFGVLSLHIFRLGARVHGHARWQGVQHFFLVFYLCVINIHISLGVRWWAVPVCPSCVHATHTHSTRATLALRAVLRRYSHHFRVHRGIHE